MTDKLKSAFLYTMSKLHMPTVRDQVANRSVMDLIKSITALVTKDVAKVFKLTREERKLLIIDVLRDVAKGADGTFGTSDDLIDRATVDELVLLLNTAFIDHVLSLVEELQRGKYCKAIKRLPVCCYNIL